MTTAPHDDDPSTTILQIIPADGWCSEDRPHAPFDGAIKKAKGYRYSHERLLCLALVEYVYVNSPEELRETGQATETFRRVVGILPYEDPGNFVERPVPSTDLDCGGTCEEGHWQALG